MQYAGVLALSGRMLKEALGVNRNALLKDAEAQSRFAETGGEADGEAVKPRRIWHMPNVCEGPDSSKICWNCRSHPS